MSDTIHLERDYTTNGITLPAGAVSTDDIRAVMRDEKGEAISLEAAKAMQQDLMKRQGRHAEYARGIHERHEVSHNSGTMAVGGGAE